MDNKTATTATFDRMTRRDDWMGFGYLGERRYNMQWKREQVAAADAAVLARAAELGWTEEQLFAWANSKLGRWFGDEAFGMNSIERGLKLVRPVD